MPALSYRVEQSPFEPGKLLQGGVVVRSPEDSLIAEAIRVAKLLDTKGPRTQDWARLQGTLEGLLLAIATIQAGSDYFDGGAPRKLERAIRTAMAEES